METLKTSETLIEGLSAAKQDEIRNLFGGTFPEASKSFDLGKEKCVESVLPPVAENGCVDAYKVNYFDPVDSSSHIDVPIKGISLFVELTGGLTNKPDGKIIRDVGQKEFTVNVGDFVWAIIKRQKQSWWPGIVCDSSNAPIEAAKGPTREDDFLVRCFGNGNYIWCSPFEVKPFVGYFDRLPSQSKAKRFLDALEMAITELGRRVKTEFTCSCFSKMAVKKTGNFGDLSVNRFEPAKFLDYIKDLARDISMPNRIDYVVKQNCLSAFYQSLGHAQIPIHELKLTFGSPSKIKTEEENGYIDDDIDKYEKPYETRERRKSGFFSYPGECGIEVSKVDDYEGVDLSQTNGESQPVKKPRKKWTRKNKGVQAKVCTSEVLLQLQLAGQDCLFPFESKNFDSVERFITEFRKRAFNDLTSEIPIEMVNHQILQETLPKKARKKKDKSVISPTLVNDLNHGSMIIDFRNVGSINLESQSMPAKQGSIFNFGDLPMTQPPLCKLEPKRRKKNEENITSMHTWNADISTLPNVNGHMALYQAPVFHFTNEFGSSQPCFTGNRGQPQVGVVPTGLNHGEPQVGLVPTGLTHVPKKRGRKRKNFDLQANRGSTIIQNLNENGTEIKKEKRIKKSKEIGVPCIDLSYNKVQQDNLEVKGTAFLLKFSSDYPLPTNQDLISVFSKYGALIESETQVLNENLSGQVVFLDSSSAGGAFWGLQNDKPFGPVLVNYKIQHLSGSESMVQFKTPIKSPSGPRPMDFTIGPTMIPDLNTNSTEIKIVKKSKTIEEIRLPSMDNNLSYSKIHQSNGEFKGTGTALILKFSPNYPLPSYQDLNSVFCKYGELNEFETRVLGQSLTGQVVFVNPSTAGDAIQRLEKDRPFGPGLLSYRVHHLYNVQSAIQVKSLIKPPPQDLGVIKKNLEMMNLMLEKSGDGLSPEMRGKLESEIKGLMNKVSAIDGGGSSSSPL